MKVLLITPPMVQINTPYPATPVLTGFLREQGVDAVQADLSLAVALKLFSREGVLKAAEAGAALAAPSAHLAAFLRDRDRYLRGVDCAVSFLQGRSPELAWTLGRRGFLPENTHFRELDPSGEGLAEENLRDFFGILGIHDRAKLFASLFLDDLADVFREAFDSEFGLSKYAERLAVAAPSFDPLHVRLVADNPTVLDAMIDAMTRELLERHRPDVVGLTCPFPGTVYGAFRVAGCVRRHAPGTMIVLGGGYVNSELRELDDPRVFDFVDAVCFDEGFGPWLGIVGKGERQNILTREGFAPAKPREPEPFRVRVSDYTGLELDRYLALVETANPMHRLWSDGRWLKAQLSNGCYWHRCAFCDVGLDYIGAYAAPAPAQAVDALAAMKRATGLNAFHFTDEALPPAVLRGVCREIASRGEAFSWWGNIRLDAAFDDALVAQMAESGCIAVSAGLECANDRLLKLMNKGITRRRAREVCERLAARGILVHLYLMYGFPTETAEETIDALDFVRVLFADGLVQSAYWHRFALTVHSPIAKDPDRFGIRLKAEPRSDRVFARNEIGYEEAGAPNHAALGEGLRVATYNFMRGAGLELPIEYWFGGSPRRRRSKMKE